MTGKEFKQLIEQVTQDGKVNTMPELFELLGSLPDDMTLEEYIRKQALEATEEVSEDVVKEVMYEETASDEDIDSIFEKDSEGGDDEPDGGA